MRKIISLLFLLSIFPVILLAQSTTVSGTVQDTGSQTWNGGTFSITFVPSVANPVGPYTWSGGNLRTTISGSLSGTGTYSVSVPSNSAVSPGGSQWVFQFCPQASAQCFTVGPITIFGGTQTVNATPPAILINLQTAVPPVFAYSTSEVTGAQLGSQFWLVGSGMQFCSAVNGNACLTWVPAGGGASPAAPNFQAQVYNNGALANTPCFNVTVPSSSAAFGNEDCDIHTIGPNPANDIMRFGARPVAPGSNPTATATCVSGSPNVSLNIASTFKTGDWVVIYNCGTLTVNTPAAPTLAVDIASGATNTLRDVSGPTGSSTLCFQLLSRTFLGGTSVSPETCTSTAFGTQGLNPVALTSVSMTNSLATYTASAAHGLTVGALVRIVGVTTPEVSNTSFFNGWFFVNTVPDSTHFTVGINADTRSGAVATGTGGTVNSWPDVHIVATATTNNYEYYVYGPASGAGKTIIGPMNPQPWGTTCASLFPLGDGGTCLTFDYFGSTVNAASNVPSYIPTTVPAAGSTNDMLLAQIVSGGGTTSLVLSKNAGNSTTATIVRDDAQALLAAWNYSAAGGTQAGPLLIPSTGDPHTEFIFNAPINLPNQGSFRPVIQQAGNILLNEPVVITTYSRWVRVPGGSQITPGFSQQVQPQLICNLASPGIYVAGLNSIFMDGLNMQEANTFNSVCFLQDGGGIPASSFQNMTWSYGAGGTNHSNINAIWRGGIGADMPFRNITSTGTENNSYADSTPSLYFNQLSNVTFDWLYLSNQGIAILPNFQGAGSYVSLKDVYCQACYTPYVAIMGGGNVSGKVSNFINDTGFDNTEITNYGGAVISFSADTGANVTSGGDPTVGATIASVDSQGSATFFTPIQGGKGIDEHNSRYFVNDGTFGRISIGLDTFSRSKKLVQGYSYFTGTGAYTPPTCTVSSGGSVPVGTYFFAYAPIFVWSGGEGQMSQFCTAQTTTGNQTITLTIPSAIAGSLTYSWFDSNTNSFTYNYCGSGVNGLTRTITSGICSGGGGATQAAASGPAGFKNSIVGAQSMYVGLTNVTSNATVQRSIAWPDASGNVLVAGAPLPFAYDNFNRANGALGANWSVNGGSLTITSNAVIGTGSNNTWDVAAYVGPGASIIPTTAQFAETSTSTVNVNNFMGPAAFVQSGLSNSYFCLEGTTALTIRKLVGGTATTLVTASITGSAQDTVRLEASASGGTTTLNCYLNGVLTLTTTDSTYLSGSPGLVYIASGGGNVAFLDNWSGGSLNPIAALNNEQDFFFPAHPMSLTVGGTSPIPGTLPYGSIFSSLWVPNSGLCTDSTGKAVTTGCAAGTITGMTSGQVAIAGSATSITSSKPIQGTDTNVLSSGTISGTAAALCTDANGGATTTGCAGGSISGLTTGQIPVAGSASSLTSSKPLQGSDSSILTSSTIAAGAGNSLCTDTGSGATTTGCPTLSGLTSGQVAIAGSANSVTSSKALQGTDSNVLSSGTVAAGANNALCTDANSGATTSGCNGTVYNTQSSATNSNIAVTTMVAATSAIHSYQFSWTISLTAVGVGCSSSTTVNMNAVFTDPNSSSTTVELLGTITIAAGGNGTVGFVAQGTENILAKASSSVSYSTSGYTAGTGCTTNPTYQVSPTLVQLW